MLDVLTLRALTTSPDGSTGKAVQTAATTDVFADVQSVKRSEYYAADAAGQSVDIVFIVNSDEYNGQKEAVHNGTTYTIVRSYQTGQGRTELTCARR
jgi:SPP1 family predicted phage head-tail adaptor